MPPVNWDHRFFATTRGRILTHLRRSCQTVDELATALELSDNAVRSHLYALERDGFVMHEGVRRGQGKPAWVYRLAPEAERIFPKPYAPVLNTMLTVLSERLPPEALDAALVETGRRLAGSLAPASGDIDARLPQVMRALADMGGLAELDTSDHTIVIRGFDCPLASTVQAHPEACRVLQSLLETVLETPVEERCERGATPRCCFAVHPPATPDRSA